MRYDRRCDACGESFGTNRTNQRFCSKGCSHRRAARREVVALPDFRVCACGENFKPVRRDSFYCSPQCNVRELKNGYKKSFPEYREQALASTRNWALDHPERMARYTKESRFRTKYGIELRDFEARVEAQNSCCSVCSAQVVLVPDHDHATGQFRGAVCGLCNSGIGFFEDDPERLLAAASYLIQMSPPSGVGANENEFERTRTDA